MSDSGELHSVTLEINGAHRTVTAEARRLLVHLIREDLGLTGTHVGCDTSQCGACTVEIDGQAVKSCTVLAVMTDYGQDYVDSAGLDCTPQVRHDNLGDRHSEDDLWQQEGRTVGFRRLTS
ncbi:succinate dehydrogenase/fumarate reductase-like Fe-S protein [Bradyrhizobium sp. USDA 4369]